MQFILPPVPHNKRGFFQRRCKGRDYFPLVQEKQLKSLPLFYKLLHTKGLIVTEHCFPKSDKISVCVK
jgi:hypothetical protein